jgi:Fe-Mn family superoxide dismutase
VAYELPPLPYDYAALEPSIDEATMKLHHDKHHQTYVTNLNGAVEKHPEIGKKSPEELLKDLASIPEDVRKVVQNNGGGHVNHTMFWQIMKPKGGGEPSGDIAAQIKADFGNFEDFKKQFNETTAKQFGSGWGWLIFEGGKLKIVTTANQDTTPSSATTSGSTPTTSSTRTSGQTTSQPGGIPSTGTRSTSASPLPNRTSN